MAGLRTNSNIVRDPETEINAVAECAAPIVLAGYIRDRSTSNATRIVGLRSRDGNAGMSKSSRMES